ncbi:MAG: hypothetical protein JNM75_08845 [Rhodospirillales bacterium]|nr:hypothetical protein [Rhodospirillales bacterium]
MRRHPYCPKSYPEYPATAFENAEEAWFWFIRCQQMRRDGAKLDGDLDTTARPCDPDDVYRAADRLVRNGTIRSAHIKVLVHYGHLQRTPDPRCAEQVKATQFWSEAIDRLSSPLRAKGIIR